MRTVKSAPPSGFLESRESFLEGWREVGEVCFFVLCCVFVMWGEVLMWGGAWICRSTRSRSLRRMRRIIGWSSMRFKGLEIVCLHLLVPVCSPIFLIIVDRVADSSRTRLRVRSDIQRCSSTLPRSVLPPVTLSLFTVSQIPERHSN